MPVRAQYRRAATRARAIERKVAALLRRYTLAILDSEIRAARIEKARDGADELAEMTRLLQRFGLVQMSDAAVKVGGSIEARSQMVVDEMMRKEVLVQGIAEDIRDQVRDQIKRLVVRGMTSTPPDTVADIARRIKDYYKGNIYGPAAAGAKDWDEITNNRAALIARTESVQAHNTGRAAGFESLGIEYITWIAYTDGRSEDRHHERMNGKAVQLGDKFKTPLGNELRWPGDPAGPIRETANCRCSIRPATAEEIARLSQAA